MAPSCNGDDESVADVPVIDALSSALDELLAITPAAILNLRVEDVQEVYG